MIFETVMGSVTTVAVAYFGAAQYRTHRKVQKAEEDNAEIKAQVKNSHTTNLRDDIDKILDAQNRLRDGIEFLVAGQATHTQQLSQFGLDIGLERRERIIATERLDRHIDNHQRDGGNG